MTYFKTLGVLHLALLTACSNAVPGDKTRDGGIGGHDLTDMVAGVWVDPNGCDHWIIDDGLEGYMSERLTPDGRPVCSGVAAPATVIGPFKSGSILPDPVSESNFR